MTIKDKAAGTATSLAAQNNFIRRNYSKNSAKFTQKFDRDLLPTPAKYYSQQFKNFRIKSEWVKVICPFHDDHNPSLNVNLVFGGFRCFVCGAHGCDVLAFQMQRYKQSFKQAAIALGAWRGQK